MHSGSESAIYCKLINCMVSFSVIQLKVSVILLDYQLFIDYVHTQFAATTISSFKATFSFYPLLFEKHITSSQNYDYLPNTEELIVSIFKKLTEFKTGPPVTYSFILQCHISVFEVDDVVVGFCFADKFAVQINLLILI